jgi:hypothetical protein
MRTMRTLVEYSLHKSCTLGFHGTRVSYQFNIRPYICRDVPLVHFSTSMLLIPGYRIDFHHHVTPISRCQIFLTHPHRGTKFPNPHNFILATFLVVAISILPPPHPSNRPNQSILPWFSFFLFEPALLVSVSCNLLLS